MKRRYDLHHPNVVRKVVHYKNKGVSYTDIGHIIADEHGIKRPSNHILKTIYETMKEKIPKEIDVGLKTQISAEIINVRDQLIKINRMVNEIIDDPKTDKKTKLFAFDKVLNQLEFQRKCYEMFVTKKETSAGDVTKIIMDTLISLERDGYIKILRSLPKGLNKKPIVTAEFEEIEGGLENENMG